MRGLRRLRGPRGRAGLTLLEVLVSLTLLALVTTLVYGSLNTALTSWSAGIASGRRDQVARIALERMMQQLKSLVPATRLVERRPRAAFEADGDSLRFVTLQTVGPVAPAVVSYSLEEGDEGRRLVYREFPWPDKEGFGDGDPRLEEFLPEIDGLEIIVTEADDEGAGGAAASAAPGRDSEAEFPAAVQIRLRAAGGEADGERDFGVFVPLPVQPPRDSGFGFQAPRAF